MLSDFRSSSQVVESQFGVQKNVGRSFCERELGQFCASPLFSDEKQSEEFFLKENPERERERGRKRNGGKRKKLFFIQIIYFMRFFIQLIY